MHRLRLERLSPRARFVARSAVLLALVVVFVVEERSASLEQATSAHEAALAGRLSSARSPKGIAADRLPRREARALDRALGELASARAGSVRLFNRDRELVYSGGRRLDRSTADISQVLESGVRGSVGSARVTGARGATRDQLATVIPVRATPAGPVVGAFEVRRPWKSIAGRADLSSWAGLLPVLVALTLAWAGMLVAGSMAMRGRAGRPSPLTEAQLDPLTGLPNRATFRDLLGRSTAAAKRSAGHVAVIVMDLDRFKEINDTLGHFNGDMLLKRIGPRLTTVLRDQDTVARLGGDEFAILLPGLSDHAAITTAAKRITGVFAEPFVLGGLAIEIEASIGIAVAPEHGDRVDVLLQRADTAMYAAKGGAHRVRLLLRRAGPELAPAPHARRRVAPGDRRGRDHPLLPTKGAARDR